MWMAAADYFLYNIPLSPIIHAFSMHIFHLYAFCSVNWRLVLIFLQVAQEVALPDDDEDI